MNRYNRFLDAEYVIHSARIKRRAFNLKRLHGWYPYSHFKDKVELIDNLKLELSRVDAYTSLTYFNAAEADAFHTSKSVTVQLILGLTIFNDFLEHGMKGTDVLDLAERIYILSDDGNFTFDKPYARFDLTGRYGSGIVQGKAASFFVRCYKISNDEKYLDWASKCLYSSLKSMENGGQLIVPAENQIWIEEYPSPRPSMVLNGFLFYLIGLADYLNERKDSDLKNTLDQGITTVISWLPYYKVQGGLLYSMYRWNFCNVHYTGVMKYLFHHIYKLTNQPIFLEYANYCDELTNWKTFNRMIKK